MKYFTKFFLSIIIYLSLNFLVISCNKDESIGMPIYPIDVEIQGVDVTNIDGIATISLPANGGDFTLEANGRNAEYGYIYHMYDITGVRDFGMKDDHVIPTPSDPPFGGSDSWLTGFWWKVTYLHDTVPYKIHFHIDPNETDKRRELAVDMGSFNYMYQFIIYQEANTLDK